MLIAKLSEFLLQLLALGEKMEPVFFQVLNMSFTAFYVFVVVMLCRLLLKKAPKIYSYVLWFVLLFRLLCPIAMPSPLSVLNLLALEGNQTIMEYIPSDIGMYRNPTVNSGIPVVSQIINQMLPAPDPNVLSSANPLQILSVIFSNIWLLGIYAFVIYTLVSAVRMRKLTQTAIQIAPDVYECEFLASPFVKGLFAQGLFGTGFLQARIYLPAIFLKRKRGSFWPMSAHICVAWILS